MEGLLQLSYLPSQNLLVDVFTKVLPIAQHQDLRSKLGMVPTSPSPSLRGGGVGVIIPTSNQLSSSSYQQVKPTT